MAAMFLALACAARAAEASPPPTQATPTPAVIDVQLQPGGCLTGRVALTRPDGGPAAPAAQVSVVQGPQVVATASTDTEGRFVIGGLSGGLYQVVVDVGECRHRQWCRLWEPGAGPPCAVGVLDIRLSPVVVRGQSFLPSLASRQFRRRAAFGTLVAGAIAAPIIFAGTARDTDVPKSP